MVSQREGMIDGLGVSDMDRHRILILGGTTEARSLAEHLSLRSEFETAISLAGRTETPKPLPVATRIGGFGGAQGLANHLREQNIDLLIDATHPFANQISANAVEAARTTGASILALSRPGWLRQPGDRWISVGNIDAASIALGDTPRRVFLSIGRQEAHRFSAAPRHFYLVRSIDPVEPPLAVPDCQYILSGGPFSTEAEIDLFRFNRIDTLVTKNSGGNATYAKIEAARTLGLAVIIVERQPPPGVRTVHDVETALEVIDQLLLPEKKRGV
jgi:precorrin-6A/cobalt-precorrin-6A reductase